MSTPTPKTETDDPGIRAGVAKGVPYLVIMVFLSISFYNFIELNLIIYSTFKRRSGLYFWSFIISTWGVAIWSLGWLMKTTGVTAHIPNHYLLYMTFIEVGFVFMVTGQGFVLYSRLHIMVHSHRKLRLCLTMVIVDGIICHVPIAVLAYGSNSPNPGPFLVPYAAYMKVQVTIFFIQELILSAIYIHETLKMMRNERRVGITVGKGSSRKLMKHLILVNLVVIVLDVTILALEYNGFYSIQTAYKGMVYSVKLKMEFSILNRLVEMVGGPASSGGTRGLPSVTNRSRIDAMDRSRAIPMDDMMDKTSGDVIGDGRIRGRVDGDLEHGDVGMGYNAFARSGHRDGDHAGSNTKGMGVQGMSANGGRVITRTTEVRVHHEDFLDDDSSDGTATADGQSERGIGGNRRARENTSSTSSEVQFAKS
ncbi:hypothetical protein OQA88_12599 [Cercophora sp. LCS_1]